MGVDAADFNEDGWPDLFVANIDREMYSLYQNNHDETFDDQAGVAGIAAAWARTAGAIPASSRIHTAAPHCFEPRLAVPTISSTIAFVNGAVVTNLAPCACMRASSALPTASTKET